MRLLVSRDISVVFSDLVALGYGFAMRGQAPQPRSGALKAQGLRARRNP
jgi:hypothetical protein